MEGIKSSIINIDKTLYVRIPKHLAEYFKISKDSNVSLTFNDEANINIKLE